MTSRHLLVIVACLLAVNSVLPAAWARHAGTPLRAASDVLLWPITAVLHDASTPAVSKTVDVGADPAQHPALALQRIQQLQDQVRRLTQEVQTLRKVREVLGSNARLVRAEVIGLDDAQPRRGLRIRKGSNAGLKAGQVVIFGPHLVGRIDVADALTSRLTLIDSPGDQFQVGFSSPDLTQPPREELIYVKAGKDGLFHSLDGIDRDTALRVGDLARLIDPRWPEESQAFLLGKIVAIRPLPDMLRSDVVIEPAIPLAELASVDVLVPE